MFVLAAFGTVLAGLILFLRDALPWFGGLTGGAIRTRGARAQLVRRADDPERFAAVMRKRVQGMGLPLVVLAVGAVWSANFLIAMLTAGAAR